MKIYLAWVRILRLWGVQMSDYEMWGGHLPFRLNSGDGHNFGLLIPTLWMICCQIGQLDRLESKSSSTTSGVSGRNSCHLQRVLHIIWWVTTKRKRQNCPKRSVFVGYLQSLTFTTWFTVLSQAIKGKDLFTLISARSVGIWLI